MDNQIIENKAICFGESLLYSIFIRGMSIDFIRYLYEEDKIRKKTAYC